MREEMANCGCVYHAEDGIPCIHDLQLRATTHFKETLAKSEKPHDGLIVLEDGGWEEEMPSDGTWHFVHPDYPKVMIDWSPGREPIAHPTRMEAWRYKRRKA